MFSGLFKASVSSPISNNITNPLQEMNDRAPDERDSNQNDLQNHQLAHNRYSYYSNSRTDNDR